MKDKIYVFSTFFVLIIFSALGIWTIFIEPRIANKENENFKILSNRKALIQKRSDEIYDSKLNEAKKEGNSNLSLKDGIVEFSAQINYDKLTQQFQCRLTNQGSSVALSTKEMVIVVAMIYLAIIIFNTDQ